MRNNEVAVRRRGFTVYSRQYLFLLRWIDWKSIESLVWLITLFCAMYCHPNWFIMGHLRHYTEPSVTIHMFFTSCFLTSLRACLHEGRVALARVLTLPRRIVFFFFKRCDYKVGR